MPDSSYIGAWRGESPRGAAPPRRAPEHTLRRARMLVCQQSCRNCSTPAWIRRAEPNLRLGLPQLSARGGGGASRRGRISPARAPAAPSARPDNLHAYRAPLSRMSAAGALLRSARAPQYVRALRHGPLSFTGAPAVSISGSPVRHTGSRAVTRQFCWCGGGGLTPARRWSMAAADKDRSGRTH